MTQAVALSGGPDSLCAAAHMPPGLALIVDHGLRPDSRREAERAADQARALGHQPKILTWDHERDQSRDQKSNQRGDSEKVFKIDAFKTEASKTKVPRTQAAYRAGRYALLAGACHRYGIDRLWTGHQGDDQAETLLLRMSMGSGLMGLSGMAQSTWLGNTRLYRPLLTKSKSDILRWLKDRGLSATYDPSNGDPAYPRVAWRGALTLRPEMRAHLSALSRDMGQIRNRVLQDIPQHEVRVHGPGILTLGGQICTLNRALLHELLAACVRWIGGRVFAPLDRVIDFVQTPPRSRAQIATGSTLISWRRDLQVFTLVPEVREDVQKTLGATGDSALVSDQVHSDQVNSNLMDMDQMASTSVDMDLVRRAASKIAKRQWETNAGLWLPGNQQKYGGLILGDRPRFDHEYATNLTDFCFKD